VADAELLGLVSGAIWRENRPRFSRLGRDERQPHTAIVPPPAADAISKGMTPSWMYVHAIERQSNAAWRFDRQAMRSRGFSRCNASSIVIATEAIRLETCRARV